MQKCEVKKLRDWCWENDYKVRYLTALTWMRRNNATADQTIERYSGGYFTVKEKCEAAGIDYGKVMMRMHRKDETADEAIAYYQGDTRSVEQKSKDAGVKHYIVRSIMHRYRIPVEDAIEIAIERAKTPRRELNITPVAEEYGIHYQRIYHRMEKTGCTPEEAARFLLEKDRKKGKRAKPNNNPLTKNWV